MKKLVLIVFFLEVIIYNNTYTHDNKWVHQKIMIEAYKLLKIQFSKEYSGIADIDQYIGTIMDHNQFYWHNVSTLTGGADHEDREDIVYGYGWPYGWTHFWYADRPYTQVRLLGKRYPTAYTKACTYIWDNFSKVISNAYNLGHIAGHRERISKGNKNTYLYQYYWKDKIHIDIDRDVNFGIVTKKRPGNYDWEIGQNKCREIFFNILGRLCHLLMDMGVPEHVNGSAHILPYSSPLEHWLSDNHSEFYWTADKVYKERGGFINPFCEVDGDQNIFLFYTLAQLSDWFACYGRNWGDGNNDFNPYVGEIQSILTSYAPSIVPYQDRDWYFGINDEAIWIIPDSYARKIRDVLLPYTIRAVAGMLYKFIIEAKMQFPEETESDGGSIYGQQQELNLFNQDIDGNHYTFRAEGNPGRITVCPISRPDGYPADFKIGENARNVTFRAAKEIIFRPGFIAQKGAQIHAYLNCNCTRLSQPDNCKQCLYEDFNPQYDKSGQ